MPRPRRKRPWDGTSTDEPRYGRTPTPADGRQRILRGTVHTRGYDRRADVSSASNARREHPAFRTACATLRTATENPRLNGVLSKQTAQGKAHSIDRVSLSPIKSTLSRNLRETEHGRLERAALTTSCGPQAPLSVRADGRAERNGRKCFAGYVSGAISNCKAWSSGPSIRIKDDSRRFAGAVPTQAGNCVSASRMASRHLRAAQRYEVKGEYHSLDAIEPQGLAPARRSNTKRRLKSEGL